MPGYYARQCCCVPTLSQDSNVSAADRPALRDFASQLASEPGIGRPRPHRQVPRGPQFFS